MRSANAVGTIGCLVRTEFKRAKFTVCRLLLFKGERGDTAQRRAL